MLEGLPPNNAAFLMRLRCADSTTAQRVADIIVETFDPAETAASAFEETGDRPDIEGPWLVEAYFGTAPDEAQVRELVSLAAGAELAAEAEFGRVAKDRLGRRLARRDRAGARRAFSAPRRA